MIGITAATRRAETAGTMAYFDHVQQSEGADKRRLAVKDDSKVQRNTEVTGTLAAGFENGFYSSAQGHFDAAA